MKDNVFRDSRAFENKEARKKRKKQKTSFIEDLDGPSSMLHTICFLMLYCHAKLNAEGGKSKSKGVPWFLKIALKRVGFTDQFLSQWNYWDKRSISKS